MFDTGAKEIKATEGYRNADTGAKTNRSDRRLPSLIRAPGEMQKKNEGCRRSCCRCRQNNKYYMQYLVLPLIKVSSLSLEMKETNTIAVVVNATMEFPVH